MAAGLLDRYFDSVKEQVAKQNVQKLGIVALFLAAKYEEIYPLVYYYIFVTFCKPFNVSVHQSMIWSTIAMGRIQLRICSSARLTCLPC